MAVKKSELYSSLWASCDALRGGMDASQYKDYILTLLFVKYVSDKFMGEDYADVEVPEGGSFDDMVQLIGKKNIGEGINKVIAKLAAANNLRGVIDKVSFNDPDKLGKGDEMVKKLSKLIEIFRRPELDFSKNRAEDDDLIGDAYEYLMRKFATESGKSKGQFYTPAEVSRILAKVIGISKENRPSATIYDPACGSGSLLIRALNEAPIDLSGYGQEKDTTTAGLAIMNAVLHNKVATIKAGNTFSDPQYFENGSDETVLRRFDYIVANPPFSIKNWTDGVKEYGRFDGYGERPPEKNGDYAWLMHILKSLKRTGKAAIILPHGVLFRGNADAYETIHKIKRTLRAILSHAKKQRLINDNYASADFIDFPKRPPKEIDYMNDEDAKKFYAAAETYPDIRHKTAAMILLLTGMRRGELCGLEWSNIDFKEGTITIARSVSTVAGFGVVEKDPKTESSKRVIAISDKLLSVLTEYKEWYDKYRQDMGDQWQETDRLFIAECGGRLYPGTIDNWMYKVCDAAGLPHRTVHSLRHTNITMQIAAGVPLVTVAGRAGHARTSTTTDIYSHFLKSSDKTAAEKLEQLFE